jgi:hypothetical protein
MEYMVEEGGPWHMMDGLFLEESSSFVVVVVSAAYSLIRQPTIGEGPHGIIAPESMMEL